MNCKKADNTHGVGFSILLLAIAWGSLNVVSYYHPVNTDIHTYNAGGCDFSQFSSHAAAYITLVAPVPHMNNNVTPNGTPNAERVSSGVNWGFLRVNWGFLRVNWGFVRVNWGFVRVNYINTHMTTHMHNHMVNLMVVLRCYCKIYIGIVKSTVEALRYKGSEPFETLPNPYLLFIQLKSDSNGNTRSTHSNTTFL